MIFNLCNLPHNNKIALKLNDFNSFKRYLINQSHAWSLIPRKTIRWRRYYRNHIFYPPITKPTTIEEYQLCHYALWMVISEFNLSRKPQIYIQLPEIKLNCYACEGANHNSDNFFTTNICERCPIYHGGDNTYKCGKEYSNWVNANAEDKWLWAEKIAKLKWRKTF